VINYDNRYDGPKAPEPRGAPEQDSRPYATIPVTTIDPPIFFDCKEPEDTAEAVWTYEQDSRPYANIPHEQISTTAATQQHHIENTPDTSSTPSQRPRSLTQYLDKNKLWLIQATKSPICPIDLAARMALQHKDPNTMTEFDQRKRCAPWEIEYLPGAAPPPQVRITDPPVNTPDETYSPKSDDSELEAITSSKRGKREVPFDFPPTYFRETERMAVVVPPQ